MTDRERLIEILSDNKLWCPSKKTQWGRVADAIIAEGFVDVIKCSKHYDRIVAEKDKRIAELEEQINNYILRSVNNQKILNGEGKDGG